VNTFDTLGRRTKMTDPDLGTRTYGYDRNGNRVSEKDGKGQTIGYACDALNRLTKKTFSTNDPAVVYTYDTAPNGKGRVASMDNGSAKTTCDAYDALGRLKQVTKLIGGTSFTTRYAYDLSGKKTMVTYPDGTIVDYVYHSGSNLLWRVSTGGTVYGECTDYEPTGKMKRMAQGNGTVTLYGYDAKSTRLLSIVTTAKSGEVLQKKVYQYTRTGDLKQIRDDLKKVTYDYTYDGLHRLTAEKETKAGGQVSTDTYAYDEIGNITSKRVDGVSFTYGYDTARPHAVRSVTTNGKAHYFSYDENGNLTYGPDLTDPAAPGWRALAWTGDNMPKEIKYKDKTAPVTIRFAYDGEGRRTKKTVSVLNLTRGTTISIDPKIASTTLYVDDSYQLINGKTVKYLFAGTMRIAEIRNGAIHYYHKDHLGSSSVLTDANGSLIESAEYLPFGQLREYAGTWTTDYKFTDREMDTESGLYNFNARLYDPTLGRFISPDSIVQDPYDPQILNRYAYCRNNPLVYIDPSGHFFGTGFIVGAILGGIFAAVQNNCDVGSILLGATIGGISGGVFTDVSGYVSGAIGKTIGGTLISSAAGGIAAGATAGGLTAVFNSGNIWEGITSGAGMGAISGAAFGAIAGYYGELWTLGRVALHSVAGGAVAALSGGSVDKGVLIALAMASAAYTYNRLVNYGATWEPGEGVVSKGQNDSPSDNRINIGFATRTPGKGFWDEGGPVSFYLNRIRGINAVAGLHDKFQVALTSLGLREILNVPGMIPAAAITYPALMASDMESTVMMYILQKRK